MAIQVYRPRKGGNKIPDTVKVRTERRILDYAARNCAGKFTRIDVISAAPLLLELSSRKSLRLCRLGSAVARIDGASPFIPTPMRSTNRAF